MQIADANIILRYLLKDDKTQFSQAKLILEKNEIFIPFEITAEVVYVLEKVYSISREEISSALGECNKTIYWVLKLDVCNNNLLICIIYELFYYTPQVNYFLIIIYVSNHKRYKRDNFLSLLNYNQHILFTKIPF